MEESNSCSETDPSELLNQLEYILESDPLIPFILYPDMHKNNFLLHRWCEKIRTSMPLHIVTLTEIAAIVSLFASFIYLLGFFGIDVVQSIISKPCVYIESDENDLIETSQICPHLMDDTKPLPKTVSSEEDDEIIYSVLIGKTPSYSLESKLGVCYRAAFIRREAVERITKRSLEGLPLDGFDYESILGQCCEMPIGYVQIPVGIAGPLSLNDCEYLMPMATTEGCLVVSTNRGCKAIYACGGATGILLKDGMAFCQAAKNSVLNGRKNLYIRFSYSTGDAMGMNMVLKGVQNVLDFLQSDFPIWM